MNRLAERGQLVGLHDEDVGLGHRGLPGFSRP
jgi:hypothetical protein